MLGTNLAKDYQHKDYRWRSVFNVFDLFNSNRLTSSFWLLQFQRHVACSRPVHHVDAFHVLVLRSALICLLEHNQTEEWHGTMAANVSQWIMFRFDDCRRSFYSEWEQNFRISSRIGHVHATAGFWWRWIVACVVWWWKVESKKGILLFPKSKE